MTRAAVGIVSGSGIEMGSLLDRIRAEYPFHAWPRLAKGNVPGHACRFIEGNCGNIPIVLQCGRLHLYEGFSFEEVVRTVDVLHELGARTVIFTNAAGGLRPEMRPGDLVAASVVRPWRWRHAVLPESISPNFIVGGCDHVGAYHWMHGPCYETRAEVAALQRLGGATVGMSTAPELVRCQALGIRAAVVSCVTNVCGVGETITHERVVETARRSSSALCRVIRGALVDFVDTVD